MFKLSDADRTTQMKAEQDELDEILRSSVPGLVSKSRGKNTSHEASDNRQGNSGTGHKILIEPSVFNMSILLPPSLSFIQRLKEIVPMDSDIATSSLTSFLDDFLVNVFLPQLDETVTDLCTLCFIEADAFTEDAQWSTVSPRPVFKGTIKFMSIIKEFSKILSSIPHDQAFSQLLITQIMTYYDKCFGWYKGEQKRIKQFSESSSNDSAVIVTKLSPRESRTVRLKAAAQFADSGEIHDVVRDLWEEKAANKQISIDTVGVYRIEHRPKDQLTALGNRPPPSTHR